MKKKYKYLPDYWREDHQAKQEAASLVDQPSKLAKGSPLMSPLVISEMAAEKRKDENKNENGPKEIHCYNLDSIKQALSVQSLIF